MSGPKLTVGQDGVARGTSYHGKTLKYPKRDAKPIKVKGVLYDDHRKVIGREVDSQKK
ncbi:hypothetical protein UFOVP1623_31 [uncultured Caudovirales phage]|uniref:Uncharacterized protein n=1 Tax=uncultured Caudovirales phage TaxID=2100421 RepID=A0A6J5RZH9_9CAUD|nr:hypothetical protein UFOVP1376_32 [uncultured Caudovirales phage]CAB4220757.1 hypothetical protein UFOVP1623_31 [uncultured Caudovirales phage]